MAQDDRLQSRVLIKEATVNDKPEIVGTEVIAQSGCFMRVRRYYRGWHPQLGTLHFGWSGKETIEEADVIKAMGIFTVSEES